VGAGPAGADDRPARARRGSCRGKRARSGSRGNGYAMLAGAQVSSAAVRPPCGRSRQPEARHPRPSHAMTRLTHLQRLEAESIDILREAVAESEHPVMLYSIGKDSSVMLHLARKAFHPSRPPFPLLHVDTTWKFRAMYEFRDRMAAESGAQL